MTREKLPNRRTGELVEFVHEGIRYIAHAGRFPDGRLAEMFLDAAKPGMVIDLIAKDTATILSIALQHGASVETIRAAMSQEMNGVMRGPVGVALDLLEPRG